MLKSWTRKNEFEKGLRYLGVITNLYIEGNNYNWKCQLTINIIGVMIVVEMNSMVSRVSIYCICHHWPAWEAFAKENLDWIRSALTMCIGPLFSSEYLNLLKKQRELTTLFNYFLNKIKIIFCLFTRMKIIFSSYFSEFHLFPDFQF
jgi:hypothetical protein